MASSEKGAQNRDTTASRCLAEASCRFFERRIGARADRTDGPYADNHDQRQHHGVLDRCRTVFQDEEKLHLRCESLHLILQSSGRLVATWLDDINRGRRGTPIRSDTALCHNERIVA